MRRSPRRSASRLAPWKPTGFVWPAPPALPIRRNWWPGSCRNRRQRSSGLLKLRSAYPGGRVREVQGLLFAGQDGDEAAGTLIFRRAEHLLSGTRFHHFAMLEKHDVTGDSGSEPEIVGRHQHG